MNRPLSDAERQKLRDAGARAARAARRAAGLPEFITDKTILAKAAVLLARVDDDAPKRSGAPQGAATTIDDQPDATNAGKERRRER